MRRFSVIVGAVTLSLAGSTTVMSATAAPSGATTSAQALYNSAIAYAGTQNVHYVSKATKGGSILSVVGNTAPTSGTQTLTVKSSTSLEKLTVSLIGKTGYLHGNAPALTQILGMTAQQASTYANVWLSFPTGNQTLDELISGLRNKDVSTELKLAGPFKLGTTKTINGTSVQGVVGYTNDSSGKKIPTVLYVQTGSTPRPIEEITTPGSGNSAVNGSVTFSNWGQQTHVIKPKHSVSLISIASAA